jgi:hypothetical protein
MIACQTMGFESLDGRLVRPGGNAVCTRPKKFGVHPSQGLGVLEKDLGGPQIVFKVISEHLQAGRQSPVQNDRPLAIKEPRERIYFERASQRARRFSNVLLVVEFLMGKPTTFPTMLERHKKRGCLRETEAAPFP